MADGHRVGGLLCLMSARVAAGERAKELGAAGFLAKPFDMDAMLAAVRRGLEVAGAA